MSKVLITGSTGFIGPYVVQAVQQAGHAAVCLVRRTSQLQRLAPQDVEVRTGDLNDPESLVPATRDVDLVLHLAGAIKAFDEAELHRVNAQGVAHLLKACCERTSPPVVVSVSSIAACGPAPADRPLVETDPLQPVSAYGRSKCAGEEAARTWAERLPLGIVRPAIVYGAGDRATLSIFQSIQRFGLHAVPGFTDRRVSLVHAADLAELLLRVAAAGMRLSADLHDPQAEGIYFAAGPEQPTYADFGRQVGEALGRKTRILRLPVRTARNAARCAELWGRLRGVMPMFNRDKIREAAAGDWTCDPARARDELGFEPAANLMQRLAETVQGYRQLGWLR